MKVVIGGNFWFPYGTASAARVRNLAAGLRDCGAAVHVMAMAPHPRDGSRAHGCEDGISFEHVAPTQAAASGWRDPERSIPRLRGRLTDKLAWFAGLYGAARVARRRLAERIARGDCDLFVAYDRSAIRMAPLARLCGRKGTTSVLDVVEVSEHLGASRLSAIYWDSVMGTRSTPKLFDGLSVISVGLQAAYRAPDFPPTLLVPALAAWPDAPPPATTGRAEFRLTYVGALQPRDAPELLIGAVRIAATRRADLRLDVVGHYEGTQRGRDLAGRCAADPVLRTAVRFLGSLGEAALQAQLASSDGLVLTRREALTEVLSFPTRLVEYLAHGRPVFISDVGDVSRYLQHGQEAILLHPRDPQRVAAAIEAVVRRDDRGAEIGRRGREAGAREFDRKVHARRLLDFAQSLHSRRAA